MSIIEKQIYDFEFDQGRYLRAERITNVIVNCVKQKFETMSFEHAIEMSDGSSIEGWSLDIDIGDGSKFRVMLTADFGIGEAQYFRCGDTADDSAVLAIPFDALFLWGKTYLRQRVIENIFHEVIHHMDYQDDLEFDHGVGNEDLNQRDAFLAYFRSPHEQRAFFYEGVYGSRNSIWVKLKLHHIPMIRNALKEIYFYDFTVENLGEQGLKQFEKRFNRIFLKT